VEGKMEINKIRIDKDYHICLDDFEAITKNGKSIELSDDIDYIEIINKGNLIIKDCIKNNIPIYGVTTGFGDSCRRQISYNDAKALQSNLVKYHGCGIGAYFSPSETLGIMLLRLISNARGYSGVRYVLLKQIEQFINKRILPLIPEKGSVGASGDLTPLSYLAATLTGRRKVLFNGEIIDASEALRINNLDPITLESKEGLALMNGTSVMCSIASFCVIEAKKIAKLLELTTAMTVEVLEGNKDSFAPIIHRNKPFEGQNKCADTIYNYLKSSNSAMKYK
jgi:histidine ammonia-lyase